MKFLPRLIEQLRSRTGFSQQFLPEAGLKRAVRDRMEALRISSEETYWCHLQAVEAEAEWGKLVEEIVVNETWFLRDKTVFDFLGAEARRRLPQKDTILRVLSAPCSTGEEACSIAITLLEAGWPAERFSIDAVDISARVVEFACNRTYGRQSFRGSELFKSRYFEAQSEDSYRVSALVRDCVHFSQANLLEASAIRGRTTFDILFCRNLMIYLDEPSRRRLFTVLASFLREGGLLFVGHAEAGAVPASEFQAIGPSGAFAFERRTLSAVRTSTAIKLRTLPSKLKTERVFAAKSDEKSTPSQVASAHAAPQETASLPNHEAREALARATELADAGHLDKAAALCHTFLERDKTNAKAIHLLAVIRLAEGKPDESERLFHQVAYLDPNHAETLLHLAQLAHSRGDQTAAQRWRQRFERVRGVSSQ
jgi:chemotaxis protein methyltransferase WspC